jgi:beta-glucosidase
MSSSEFNKKITISVKIKNAGSVAGREVLQVYLSVPEGKLNKPASVLIDFGKTKLLNPGESEMLSFDIEPRDLCSFDEKTSSWLAGNGEYDVKIGASSTDIRLTGTFSLSNDLVVETVSNVLAPKVDINRMR